MAVSDVSQKYDVIHRKFKNLKHRNILAFTVWLIVPITLLILQNCEFGRLAAKISNLHFRPFSSNVTFSDYEKLGVEGNVRSISDGQSNFLYSTKTIVI